jgi:hypothetical protein
MQNVKCLDAVTDQSPIYRLAEFLADRFGAAGIANIRGSDRGAAVSAAGMVVPWIEISPTDLAAAQLLNHVVVCSGLLGAPDSDPFLQQLAPVALQAHCIILAEPEESAGSRARNLHWLCQDYGLPVLFEGVTNAGKSGERSVCLQVCIIDRTANHFEESSPPGGFRPLAILTSYNDEDIIEAIVKQYLLDGIRVHLIDNWSSDKTWPILEALQNPLLSLERFPADGPTGQFELYRILRRKEEIALQYPGTWIVHSDSDEIRASPWRQRNLKEAMCFVDRSGFNCIDFTGLEFRALDNNFQSGSDPEKYFPYFEFNRRPGAFRQQKVWKQPGMRVNLADSGGHIVEFSGKKLYPYKFVKKHYGVRSQEHGTRKILRERQPRFFQEQQTRGWHRHYDHINSKHNFLGHADSLDKYDEELFRKQYLVPLISGVGILD